MSIAVEHERSLLTANQLRKHILVTVVTRSKRRVYMGALPGAKS